MRPTIDEQSRGAEGGGGAGGGDGGGGDGGGDGGSGSGTHSVANRLGEVAPVFTCVPS